MLISIFCCSDCSMVSSDEVEPYPFLLLLFSISSFCLNLSILPIVITASRRKDNVECDGAYVDLYTTVSALWSYYPEL